MRDYLGLFIENNLLSHGIKATPNTLSLFILCACISIHVRLPSSRSLFGFSISYLWHASLLPQCLCASTNQALSAWACTLCLRPCIFVNCVPSARLCALHMTLELSPSHYAITWPLLLTMRSLPIITLLLDITTHLIVSTASISLGSATQIS